MGHVRWGSQSDSPIREAKRRLARRTGCWARAMQEPDEEPEPLRLVPTDEEWAAIWQEIAEGVEGWKKLAMRLVQPTQNLGPS